MHNSTETDLLFQENEEARRAFIHFATPLIEQAVRDAFPPEFLQALVELRTTREELASARQEIDSIKSQYITAEEARQMGRDIGSEIRVPLTKSIDDHLEELKEEDTRRNQAFDLRIGEINAAVLTQGQELATMKALYSERLDQHENRLAKVESDIKTGVAAVAKNSRTLSRAVGQWITEARNKEEKTALELKRHDQAIVQFEKEIRENRDLTGNLTGDVEGLRGDVASQVLPLRDKINDLVPKVNALTVRQDAAETVLRYVEIIGNAGVYLIKTRTGNLVLALMVFLWIGFQIINALLTYQFIQRIPN